jgi:hypothetical protein
MLRRLMFTIASLAIIAIAGTPGAADTPAAMFCLLAESECTLGSQCCSKACWYDEETEESYCLACSPGGPCDPE